MMPQCVFHCLVRAMQLFEDGHTQHYVSGMLWVSERVVNYPWRHAQETGSYRTRPRQRRNRKMICHEDNSLATHASWNRQALARSLAVDFQDITQFDISDQAVCNMLYEYGVCPMRHWIDWHLQKCIALGIGTNGPEFPSLMRLS